MKEVVTDSISSTTKNYLLVASIFLLATCSSSKKNIQSEVQTDNDTNPLFSKLVINGQPTLYGQETLFADKSKEWGLESVKATHLFAVDFNNDFWTDLVLLPEHFSTPRFFKNEKGVFKELNYNPFEKLYRFQSMVFIDIDKDGVQDLVAYTLNQRTALNWEPIRVFKGTLLNSKYELKEIPNAVKTAPEPTASIVPFDYNLDGHIDLYVGNWFDMRTNPPKSRPDHLLKGEKFNFNEQSALLIDEHRFDNEFKLYSNARPTMSAALCDIDQNGRADILTSSSGGYFNKMWISQKTQGQWVFKDFGEETGYAHDPDGVGPISGGNSFYSACTDYNNDSIMDVAVGELFHAYESESVDRSSILTGETFSFPPKFIRSEYINDDGSGRWTQADRRGFFADLNNDGLIDLVIDNSGYPPKTRLVVFKQFSDHAYEDVADDWGVDLMNPSGSITMDVDRDGDLDLIVGQNTIRDSKIENRIYAFENKDSINDKSVAIRLHGKKSNRDAIGALVRIVQNNTTQTRIHQMWSGPLSSQNPNTMFVGLGKEDVKEIRVTWPIVKSETNEKNLEVVYSMSGKSFKKGTELTLCENGKFFFSLRNCP